LNRFIAARKLYELGWFPLASLLYRRMSENCSTRVLLAIAFFEIDFMDLICYMDFRIRDVTFISIGDAIPTSKAISI
jgi:hypothetical protein